MDSFVYNYLWRKSSITNAVNLQKIDDLSEVILTNVKLGKVYPEISYIQYFIRSLIITTIRMMSNDLYKAKRKEFLLFLKQNKIKSIVYNGSGIRKWMSFIFNISPSLCMLISSKIKSN